MKIKGIKSNISALESISEFLFKISGLIQFENIRKGADYTSVIENFKLLKSLNEKSQYKIKVGIAFVVMKENVKSLGNLAKLAHK